MKCKPENIVSFTSKSSVVTSTTAEPIGLFQSLSSSIKIKVVLSKVVCTIINIECFLVLWDGEVVPHINEAIGTSIKTTGPPSNVHNTTFSIPSQHNPTIFLTKEINNFDLSSYARSTLRR